MSRVLFKNLKRSEFLETAVFDKLARVLEKFPDLTERMSSTVIIAMENSQHQPGQDLFRVKVVLTKRGLRPIILEKSAANPYQAIALMGDRLFDVLQRSHSRALERHREKQRHLWSSNQDWPIAG